MPKKVITHFSLEVARVLMDLSSKTVENIYTTLQKFDLLENNTRKTQNQFKHRHHWNQNNNYSNRSRGNSSYYRRNLDTTNKRSYKAEEPRTGNYEQSGAGRNYEKKN